MPQRRTGYRLPVVRTGCRRRQSRSAHDAIVLRSSRVHGRHHSHHHSHGLSRSPNPRLSPNSLGSHRNRNGRLPRHQNPHRHRRDRSQSRALSQSRGQSRSRSRRQRIGSRRPQRGSGYLREHRAATGSRRPRRSRPPRTGPQRSTSVGDAHPSRPRFNRRLSRPCRPRLLGLAAAGIPRRPKPWIRVARPRRRRCIQNPEVRRRIPVPSPSRRPNRRLPSPRDGGTAARRTPVASRLPNFWRGFRPLRPGAAVAGAATSELVS